LQRVKDTRDAKHQEAQRGGHDGRNNNIIKQLASGAACSMWIYIGSDVVDPSPWKLFLGAGVSGGSFVCVLGG
jgi:hypothetical protein